MTTLIAPGLDALMVEQMSNDEYHARPEHSSSQLKDMLRSGAHFYSKYIAKEVEKETSYMKGLKNSIDDDARG